jgi:hypothetical protein
VITRAGKKKKKKMKERKKEKILVGMHFPILGPPLTNIPYDASSLPLLGQTHVLKRHKKNKTKLVARNTRLQ